MTQPERRYVLANDPGLATGLAFFSMEKGQDPVLLWSREVDVAGYATPIRWALDSYEHVEIACEKFTITAKTAKLSQAPYSLEQIGMMKLILMDHGRDPNSFVYQTPADAKSMFTNAKLKKLGYWHVGGEGHALDAIRHGLLYLSKTGWAPRGLL